MLEGWVNWMMNWFNLEQIKFWVRHLLSWSNFKLIQFETNKIVSWLNLRQVKLAIAQIWNRSNVKLVKMRIHSSLKKTAFWFLLEHHSILHPKPRKLSEEISKGYGWLKFLWLIWEKYLFQSVTLTNPKQIETKQFTWIWFDLTWKTVPVELFTKMVLTGGNHI